MTSDIPKTTKTKISRTTKAAASRAGGIVASIAETLPDAADAVKGSARDAYRTVETMPKSQQKTLTRASLGIGAAMFVLGAPRLLTLLAFLPAVAVAGMKLAKRAA